MLRKEVDSKLEKGSKRMNILEKDIAVFTETYKLMKEDIDEIKSMLKSFIKDADKKYTQKTTTQFIIKVLWTFWFILFTWMFGFIFNLIVSKL